MTALLAAEDLVLGSQARALNSKSDGAILRAAEAADFKGKAKTSIEILARVASTSAVPCRRRRQAGAMPGDGLDQSRRQSLRSDHGAQV